MATTPAPTPAPTPTPAAAPARVRNGPSWTSNLPGILVALAVLVLIMALASTIPTVEDRRIDRMAEATLSNTRTLTLDEKVAVMGPAELEDTVNLIKVRLAGAYEIPVYETQELLNKSDGLPDSKFRRALKTQYGIADLPEDWWDLPASVDGIPEFIIKDGVRVRNSYFLHITVTKAKDGRPINPYGWDDKIEATTRGANNDVDLIYNPGSHQKVLGYRIETSGPKIYEVKDDGSLTSLDTKELPAGNLIIRLPASDVRSQETYRVVRTRRNPPRL